MVASSTIPFQSFTISKLSFHTSCLKILKVQCVLQVEPEESQVRTSEFIGLYFHLF